MVAGLLIAGCINVSRIQRERFARCTQMLPPEKFRAFVRKQAMWQARLQTARITSPEIQRRGLQRIAKEFGLTLDSARKVTECYLEFPDSLSRWLQKDLEDSLLLFLGPRDLSR